MKLNARGAAKLVIPSVIASMVVSYIFWDLTRNRKIFGGSTPRTLSKEWADATERRKDEGWPTTANQHPVVLNPITRKNYRVVAPVEVDRAA